MICANRTLLPIASAMLLATTLRLPAATVAPPLAHAYQQVLSSMRSPAGSGLLITSVQLPHNLTHLGVQPGDVITRLGGTRMRDLTTLRAVLAAHRRSKQPLSMIVVRGTTIQQFLADLPALKTLANIGLITVRAGAAAPLNPPATPRKELQLQWSRVQTLEPHGRQAVGHDIRMLVFYHQLVVGAIHLKVSHLGPSWKLLWNQESVSGGPLPAIAWRIDFRPGNYQHAPALRMTSFTRWSKQGSLRGSRIGNNIETVFLSAKNKLSASRTVLSSASAAPLPLLALLASAMPPQRDRVLPIIDLAQDTLETRLGCVMTSGHQQQIHFAGADQPVRVMRILWMDIVRDKFWISPRGALLGMHFGPGFSAYRVSGASVVRRIIPKSRLIDILPATVSIRRTSGE